MVRDRQRPSANPPAPQPEVPEPYVGYKHPPQKTRFQKGKSGNPKGRPKRETTILGAVGKELATKIKVVEGASGRTKTVTKAEALGKKLVNAALNGDQKSQDLLVRMSPGELGLTPAQWESAPAFAELTETDRQQLRRVLEMQRRKGGENE